MCPISTERMALRVCVDNTNLLPLWLQSDFIEWNKDWKVKTRYSIFSSSFSFCISLRQFGTPNTLAKKFILKSVQTILSLILSRCGTRSAFSIVVAVPKGSLKIVFYIILFNPEVVGIHYWSWVLLVTDSNCCCRCDCKWSMIENTLHYNIEPDSLRFRTISSTEPCY